MSDLHQSLVDTAYERWEVDKGMSKAAFHDMLTPQERFAVHTGNFNYQVCNGGFTQWWDNQYGMPSTVEFLLRAMERMDTDIARAVAELLSFYKRIIGSYSPSKHFEIDEDKWERIHDKLSELDTKFYELDEQFLKDCEAHLQKGGW